jgi:hypothetical protein
VTRVRSQLAVSERRACRLIGQPRTTQRRQLKIRSDEKRLTAAIIRLAKRYGRYGYRRVTALLRAEGWKVNVKRVHRIWRREGLKVPKKQPKRGRLWPNDGSCAIAEGKSEIQPDGMSNDYRWKSVSGIRGFPHPTTLLRCQLSVTRLV